MLPLLGRRKVRLHDLIDLFGGAIKRATDKRLLPGDTRRRVAALDKRDKGVIRRVETRPCTYRAGSCDTRAGRRWVAAVYRGPRTPRFRTSMIANSRASPRRAFRGCSALAGAAVSGGIGVVLVGCRRCRYQ